MIVRILNEGQWRLSDQAVRGLNALDDAVEAAVSSGNQANVVKAGEMTHSAKGNVVIQSESGSILLEASDQIVLRVGGSSLTMKKSGVILLKGRQVIIVGPEQISLNPE